MLVRIWPEAEVYRSGLSCVDCALLPDANVSSLGVVFPR